MSIKLFKSYMSLCNDLNVNPSWEGLNKFKYIFK